MDGNRYVDWMCSWGPLIAGHAHPAVIEAVTAAAARGTSFGAPTEAEVGSGRRGDRQDPVGRDGPDGQLRHRGHHERDPPGARGHRPGEAAQVRRRLPRPRGRPAGRGRLRARHRRDPGLAGRARGPGRRNRDRPVERHARRSRPRWPSTRWPRSSPSPTRRTWAWCRRRRDSFAFLREAADCQRRAAGLRRGDLRLPRGPRRGAGARGRDARPHHPRQGDRRRHARRRRTRARAS